jgi:DnaJ-class molecular chaperone
VRHKDYYSVLGVGRNAPEIEIKKAFRRLARQFHPDVASNKKQAEEKFKEINEAYEVLGDSEKRQRYDESERLNQTDGAFRPPPGAGGSRRRQGGRRGRRRASRPATEGFDFGDTSFSEMFEEAFRSGSGQDPGVGSMDEGQDVESEIGVTLEEVLLGSIRTVTTVTELLCTACRGTGRVSRRVCSGCGGRGHSMATQPCQVKIPAGIGDGQRLRIPGKGIGRPPGDLYLKVRVEKHPLFEVTGLNLVHELSLMPWNAVLGANVTVPTLEGPVKIRIPAGTQPGQKLRVRDRGLSGPRGEKGDMIVRVSIGLPSLVGDRERELWKQLADAAKQCR